MDKIYKKILNSVASFKQYWKGQPVVDYGIVTPTPPGPDYTEPFYVENITGNNETLSIVKSKASAPTITIEVSTDRINWSTLGTTDTTAITRTITPGEKLYMRASTYQWGSSSSNYHRITGVSKVGGNIMSLLYGSNFTGEETVFPSQSYIYTFTHLFSGTNQAPNNILQDASCLLLPIKEKLPENCYSYMFYSCSSITTTPELPATRISLGAYYNMFCRCSSLLKAPELPATIIDSSCYYYMFNNCSSMTQGPSILPATTVYPGCYNNMFGGCGSLIVAPELPAKTLASQCYYKMFYGCGSLNSIKCLATNISASNCLYNWTYGVNANGTFVKDANMVDWPTGTAGIPDGWTVQDV